MRYRIRHKGVPIGDVDLDLTNDPAVGIVEPLDSYGSIRDRVRSATKAFTATAFGLGDSEPTSSVVLADGAALGRELELRDDRQDLVKVDFVELADWEGKPLDITVWVRARHALSGVPSIRPDPKRTNHGSSPSDA